MINFTNLDCGAVYIFGKYINKIIVLRYKKKPYYICVENFRLLLKSLLDIISLKARCCNKIEGLSNFRYNIG